MLRLHPSGSPGKHADLRTPACWGEGTVPHPSQVLYFFLMEDMDNILLVLIWCNQILALANHILTGWRGLSRRR